MIGRVEGMAKGFDDFPRGSDEDYSVVVERACAVARAWHDVATLAHKRHSESGDDTHAALARRADDAESEWRQRADSLDEERRRRFS